MTDDNLFEELEFWASSHAPSGSVQAAQVLELLGYVELLECTGDANCEIITLLRKRILAQDKILATTEAKWLQYRRVNLALADKLATCSTTIAAQSELLSKVAEVTG